MSDKIILKLDNYFKIQMLTFSWVGTFGSPLLCFIIYFVEKVPWEFGGLEIMFITTFLLGICYFFMYYHDNMEITITEKEIHIYNSCLYWERKRTFLIDDIVQIKGKEKMFSYSLKIHFKDGFTLSLGSFPLECSSGKLPEVEFRRREIEMIKTLRRLKVLLLARTGLES